MVENHDRDILNVAQIQGGHERKSQSRSFLLDPVTIGNLLAPRQRTLRSFAPILRGADDLIATLRPNLIKVDAVNLVITGNCNIHCVYCEYPTRYRGLKELTDAEWIQIISDIRASGVRNFGIMGGEPLLRPGWSSIVDACLPGDVLLVTNGTLLNEHLADEVAARFSNVRISLDASNAGTYEAVRGNKKYARVMQAIHLLKLRGVNVDVSYVITDKNVTDTVPTAELAASLNTPIAYSIVGFENNNRTATEDRTLRDNIDKSVLVGQLTTIAHMPHVNISQKVIEFLLCVRPRRCYATVGGLMIDPLGDVYPCCGPTPPIGNVREESWSTVLSRHSSSLESYRRMKADGCSRCDAAVDGYRFLRRALSFWR